MRKVAVLARLGLMLAVAVAALLAMVWMFVAAMDGAFFTALLACVVTTVCLFVLEVLSAF